LALLPCLDDGGDFPPTETALREPNGLLAVGGTLDADLLLHAYHHGIFPWYEAPQPVLWWSPDPRSVLFPEHLHVSRSLRRRLRCDEFSLSVNRCFADVMTACAAPRSGQRGTWIDAAMLAAYTDLHLRGWAHSVEVWREGDLVGGLYGVAWGATFFGESMFSRTTDASKVALVALVHALRDAGVTMVDCQVESAHMNSLGARCLRRLDFEERLAQTRKDRAVTLSVPTTCGELLGS
jgi:leucyl/phenylalanyl-tRNA--protein transferase